MRKVGCTRGSQLAVKVALGWLLGVAVCVGQTDFISPDNTPRDFNDPNNWTAGLPGNHAQNDMTNEASAYLSANYAPASPGFRLSLSPDPGKTITFNLNGYRLENVADAFGLRGWCLNQTVYGAANARVVISNGLWLNPGATVFRAFYLASGTATNNTWTLSNIRASFQSIALGSDGGAAANNSLNIVDGSAVTARADVVVGQHGTSYDASGLRLRISSNCLLQVGAHLFVGRGTTQPVRNELRNQCLVEGPNAHLIVLTNLVVGGSSTGLSTVADCLLSISGGGYARTRDLTVGSSDPSSTKPITNNSVIVTGALSRLWVTNAAYVGISPTVVNSRVQVLDSALMAVTNAAGTASMIVSNGHITVQGGARLLADHLTLQHPGTEVRVELTAGAKTAAAIAGSGTVALNGVLHLTGQDLDKGIYRVVDFASGSGALVGATTNLTFLGTSFPDPAYSDLGIAGLEVNAAAGRVSYHVTQPSFGTMVLIR